MRTGAFIHSLLQVIFISSIVVSGGVQAQDRSQQSWGYEQAAPAPEPIIRSNQYYGGQDARSPYGPYGQQWGGTSQSNGQGSTQYPQPRWQAHEDQQPGRQPQNFGPQRQYQGQPRVYTVPLSQVGTNIVLGGTVVPYKEVELTAQIPGRVEYIAGEEGDWFKEGELLVAINDDELLARRRQVLAQLQNAQAALQNERVQYSRELWAPQSRSPSRLPGMGMPNLFDQMFTRRAGDVMGYGNPELERSADLYSYGSRIQQAQSQVAQARSSLEEVDAKLRDSRSIAPFSGVVVTKRVEVGDTVQPGQPLIQFADTTYLRLEVEVPARLMPGLDVGMILPVKLDVGDTRVDARLSQIFPVADPQRHTVKVKLDLPRGTPGGPGMYAEVLIPDVNRETQALPVIPYDAIVWRGSLPAVFVINQQGQTQLRMVRLGEAMGERTVAVLSGLQPGERILINPPPGTASGWSPKGSSQSSGSGQ